MLTDVLSCFLAGALVWSGMLQGRAPLLSASLKAEGVELATFGAASSRLY